MGILSQFSSTIAILSLIITLGIPLGLTQLVAKSNNNIELSKFLLLNSYIIAVVVTSLLTFILLVFPKQISYFILSDNSFYQYVISISFLIPFVAIQSIQEAYLRGLQKLDLLIKNSIYASLISIVIIFPVVVLFQTYGAFLGLFFYAVIFSLLTFISLKNKGLAPLLKIGNYRSHLSVMLNLLKIGSVVLAAGILFQISIFVMRKITIDNFGFFGNGICQSVLSISLNYFLFIFISLTTYTFPKISSYENDNLICEELNMSLRYIQLIMIPLICIVVIFSSLIITILYTSEFAEASSMLKFQMPGDYFKALAWILGIWLVPKSKLKEFIILEIILNVNLVGIYWILVTFHAPSHFSMFSVSYLISYIVHFIINLWVVSKYISFKFTRSNKILISKSILLLSSIITLSFFLSNLQFYVASILLFLLWTVNSVSWNEILLLKMWIKQRLNKNPGPK
ncbi:MAG: oligosaccharide flippase family protein [Ignavibacteria bacterium]|nr:oligosaccharide flippase family protein [Ignavibacteria bacterium]